MKNLFLKVVLPTTLFVSSATFLWAEAPQKPVFKDEVVYQDSRTLEMISYRDGILIRSDGAPDTAIQYLRYGSSKSDPVKIDEIPYCLAIGESSDGPLLIGLSADDKMILVREDPNGAQHVLPLPPDVFSANADRKDGERLRFIPTRHEVALTIGQTVWWKDGEWQKVTLPEVPKFYPDFHRRDMGDTFVLDGNILYVGWARGEWGGMLASIDLKAENPRWIHLSGKKHGDTSGIPNNHPICPNIAMVDGHLWVATGSAMLGDGGLFSRAPDGKWTHLIDDYLDDKWIEAGKFKLSQVGIKQIRTYSISAQTTDVAGKIHFLIPSQGVFSASLSKIDNVFYHDFSNYQKEGESYKILGHPIDMKISKNGDIFISMNAFGILAFRKNGESWSGHQITID